MLTLAFHGGKCCGIKTIHSFPYDLEYTEPQLPKVSMDSADQIGADVRSDQRFYHLSAPQETALERLKRYISYVKGYRPRHVIEVVLADSLLNYYNLQRIWEPTLLDLGFNLVTSAVNSNSENTIYIYHLVVDEDDDEDED